MALIKLGALAQDVRGSLNGTTFARNKGGAYVRSKVSPVQPVSSFIDNSRQAFKIASQAWAQQLTDAERADWIAFAAVHPFINVFGDAIILSGVAFFQAANKRLQQLGFPMVADAPLTWDVDPPGAIAPAIELDGAGNISFFVNPTNAPSGANITAYLFATKAIPPGRKPQENDFRLINAIDGTVRDNTYDFGAAYKARFTPYLPPVGAKIAVGYIYLDTDNGAISVRSGATVLTVGIPGPLIPVVEKFAEDFGGGDVSPQLETGVPHGLTTGQTVDIALVAPDALYDGSNVVTVMTPVRIKLTTRAGAATGPTATAGTLQRTA